MARRSKDKAKKALVAADEANTAAATSNKCYLLDELPAELRNRIYELVLVNKKEIIVVNKTTFPQPPLLRTCHQIRAEASSVYYLSHIFNLDVYDFNAKDIHALRNQAGAIGKKLAGDRLSFRHGGENKWSNVQQWLRSRFEDPTFPYLECETDCGGYACCAFGGAVKIVNKLARARMKWKDVLEVLKVYRDRVERKKRLKWQWD